MCRFKSMNCEFYDQLSENCRIDGKPCDIVFCHIVGVEKVSTDTPFVEGLIRKISPRESKKLTTVVKKLLAKPAFTE